MDDEPDRRATRVRSRSRLRRRRTRVTLFGATVGVILVATAVVRPPVADPSVAGLVWAAVAGVLALGLLWPVLAVRSVGASIVAAPTDSVAGQLCTMEIELTGRASGLTVAASGHGMAVLDVVSPCTIRVAFVTEQRGVFDHIRIDLGSDAPFGVLWALRSRSLPLDRPLLVGPKITSMDVLPRQRSGRDDDLGTVGSSVLGETVRSVRPYVVGDSAHLVHWPSSARVGELVVREFEPPSSTGCAVIVDLGGTDDRDLIEATASRAGGAVEAAFARGSRVMLCTAESSGSVVAEVSDSLTTQRRLATATPGLPGIPPEGWSTVWVTVRGDHE